MNELFKKTFRTVNQVNPTPRYEIKIESDLCDDEYANVEKSIEIEKEDFENLHEIFYYIISYLSHPEVPFRNIYGKGKGWELDEFGLGEIIKDICGDDLMIFTDDLPVNTIDKISIYYYDENNIKYDVKIKDIESLFSNTEDMIKTIKDLYKDWGREGGYPILMYKYKKKIKKEKLISLFYYIFKFCFKIFYVYYVNVIPSPTFTNRI